MRKLTVRYATSSKFKREEIAEISRTVMVISSSASMIVGECFEFDFLSVSTDEPLERDLTRMVTHKVRSAYRQIMSPCVVEHAGLILETFQGQNYPGGLTQPMWDAIGADGFIRSVTWAGARAIARAVVGCCDGLRVLTFVGDTNGTIANKPSGPREFYWDTVFCPDGGGGLTYAEISGKEGVARKVALSQSTKAMSACLEYLLKEPANMFADMP
jgi:XTP/dITP diphosphohydrolase